MSLLSGGTEGKGPSTRIKKKKKSTFWLLGYYLVTIIFMLYMSPSGLIYLATGSLYFLTAFIQLPVPQALPLVATKLISFSMSLFIFEV